MKYEVTTRHSFGQSIQVKNVPVDETEARRLEGFMQELILTGRKIIVTNNRKSVGQ